MLHFVFFLVRPFLLFSLLLLSVLLLSRIGLGLWQYERFDSIQSFVLLLFNGLRIDLSAIGYLLIIPAILHPWFMLSSKAQIYWLKLLKIVFLAIFSCIVFFELATPAFIIEYGFRPNRLFIEYLVYPNEVVKMLLNGHLLTLIVVISLLFVISKVGLMIIRKIVILPTQDELIMIKATSAGLSFTALLLIFFILARGTLGHRPINPSLVYFSTDPLINSLILNSSYSVAHALKQFGNEKSAAKMYGKMTTDDVIRIVRKETGLAPESFKFKERPSFNTRLPFYQGKPKNLVIILEESLGAQFVSELGGLPLTPQLDKLINEGWSFNQLYATGTRSVRGIEAVITGFTPTPARSVVKLDKSQHNFFTIANLLKDNGYTTQFIYGGESHFDNMKSFFLGNGFTDIVDFDDIQNPQFIASWGASDEDLFTQANKELNALHETNKPFFSFIFSSSNHDPFEIPSGIVSLIDYTENQLSHYNTKELARHKAIQYADYSLGKFIAHAKTQTYWQDTVFLIVADHDARASGSNLVPVKNFHIPAVILNSDQSNIKDERIVSQIDLAPTLLSLIGVRNTSPMLGHDLNNRAFTGRAIMQYADNFAYMKGKEVTILQPLKKPVNYTYDANTKDLTKSIVNNELAQIALAHSLWGSLAYENEWFKHK